MVLDEFEALVVQQVTSAIDQVAVTVAEDMKTRLAMAGHVDTGALLNSIRAEPATNEDGLITAYIHADATSNNDKVYAWFIEKGTGMYNPNSPRFTTQEGWWYMGRDGAYHFTRGMKADPFIAPALEDNIGMLDTLLDEVVSQLIG